MDVPSTSTSFCTVDNNTQNISPDVSEYTLNNIIGINTKNVYSGESEYKRQVDHLLITWTIEDFLKLKYFPDKCIRSPSFRKDNFSDSWFITIFPSFLYNHKNVIQLGLFRDTSRDKSLVFVTYKFGIKKLKITWLQERTNVRFPSNGSDHILCDIFKYFGNQSVSNGNSVTVLCEMYILYYPGVNNLLVQKASELVPDLLNLSLDLFNLSKRQELSDVKIRSRNLEIPVHKAILTTRSAVFANMLLKNDSYIDIDDEDLRHIHNILIYIYSADFYHIALNGVCIGLYECAQRFKLHGLIQLLAPMEINVSSLMKEENMTFTWKIDHFSCLNVRSDECIKSPPFYNGSKNGPIWHVDIYPEGSQGASDSIGIFLRTRDSIRVLDMKIHISVLDKFKHEHYPKSIDKPLYPNSVYGFSEYVSMKELQEAKLLTDDKLIIKCKIRSLSSIASYDKISFISHPQYEEFPCLEQLSADMENLLMEGDFSDCHLVVCDKAMFSVHRAVLSERSQGFEHLIKNYEEEECVVSINDISPEVVEEMINFIYTGKMRAYNSRFSINLYEGAKKYKLFTLAQRCSTILLYSVNEESLCDVTVFAHKHKEDLLFSRCLFYMKTIGHKIVYSLEWQNMVKKEEKLANEIFKWLKEPYDALLCLEKFSNFAVN